MKSSCFAFFKHGKTSSALVVLFALFASVWLLGCKTEDDDALPAGVEELSSDDALIGKWKDAYASIYEITRTSLDNYGTDYICYAGNKLCVAKLTDDSGYIYIRFTRAATSDWKYVEDKNLAPDVGRWYALYYSELKNSSVKISAAYKASGKSATDTLEDAIAEFTVSNGYFASNSACTKVTE